MSPRLERLKDAGPGQPVSVGPGALRAKLRGNTDQVGRTATWTRLEHRQLSRRSLVRVQAHAQTVRIYG